MTLTVCSTAFEALGRQQATAHGFSDLPIAIVPHPFGIRSRDEIRQIASDCVDDIARLMCQSATADSSPVLPPSPSERAALIEMPGDLHELNRLFLEQGWGDGLPIFAPTAERVAQVLRHTEREPGEIVGTIAPAFGAATVEHIAINAAMAGCYPEYLPVLIAATEAVAAPEFNVQGIQSTTNPAAVWIIVNGPIARELGVNSGNNCLGQGAWANAALGRALRLILQNIGGARPGEMDRATHGYPGKYTFCCAENEEASPWPPLHVERGFEAASSTVTVVGATGTLNMTSHAKSGAELLRVFADAMTCPVSPDYVHGGAPWIVLSPEHAHILHRDGLSKAEMRRRLWERSKLAAHRMTANDLARTQPSRRSELGEIGPDTMLPISPRPEDIGIIVAGGPAAHSVYVPVSAHTTAVTREIVRLR